MRRAWSGRGAVAALALVLSAGAAQAQNPPARQGLLSLEEGRIFYEVVGAGDPVVVVHGGPGLDHNYLRPGLDVLAAGNALIYYDQRGTGRSEVTLDSAAINLATFVSDIDMLREALGHDRITVLGHSFGGLLALAYARAHPDRTRALVLLNTVEPGSRFADETGRRAQAGRTEEDAAELAELTSSEAFEARNPATVSRVYQVAFRGTLRDRDRIGELNLELSTRTARDGSEVARLLGGELMGVDWWDDLSAVDVPTLIVHGRFDAPPVGMAEALAEAFPQGRLAVLQTGHFPYVEDPQGMVAAVSSFLAGIPR